MLSSRNHYDLDFHDFIKWKLVTGFHGKAVAGVDVKLVSQHIYILSVQTEFLSSLLKMQNKKLLTLKASHHAGESMHDVNLAETIV